MHWCLLNGGPAPAFGCMQRSRLRSRKPLPRCAPCAQGMGEYIIRRLPLVKHIYSAAKQVGGQLWQACSDGLLLQLRREGLSSVPACIEDGPTQP
jgi:hypothetical protein